ncbi:MAG: hypothetical protein GQ574_21505 [Crocinitomix sp.]|nr:hypothetical protein [Crocinitomix sp.]
MNTELRTSVSLFVFLLLAVLNSSAQDYYYTQCDSFKIDDTFKVVERDEAEARRSFSERTFVYCSPDSTHNAVGFVNFNTSLTTLELISHVKKDSFIFNSSRPNEYRYKYHFSNWKKINFRGGFGYVKETDLADDYNEEGQFLLQKKINGFNGTEIQLKAISSEPNSKKSLSSIGLPYMHGYRIRICHENGLANSGLLIAYETFRQSCPGASNTTLIILNETGFKKIISNFSTGEAGTFDSETVYYPIRLADGAIKLIPGDYIIYNGMDFEKVDLNKIEGYPYPEQIGVPIERLIVKTRSFTENILDENDVVQLKDDNYSYKVKVINEEPFFYEWNGEELIELGSNYYLNQLDSVINLALDSTNTEIPLKQSESPTEFNYPSSEKTENSTSITPFTSGLIGFIIGGLVVGIILLFAFRFNTSRLASSNFTIL